ncbi:helix-turn-helix transcriptional regulator [Streptomyces sp. NPDC059917]|uniref:helix-turn-helix transcriptional regulator n=1 Tax=Streptomyces sp. NPDC059917 TaxID=3347002 RepID=UPI00365DB931
MARPTARVLALLELLQSGGIRTVSELAERLDVDERTVRRYVGHLIDLDVPVESVRGRYGGYRLAPGYRMPPLMLSDDEALAVLLGLVAGRRAGLTAAPVEAAPDGPAPDATSSGTVSTGTASTGATATDTAAAKIRRVLPERLSRRLDAVLSALAFTDPPGGPVAPAAPDPSVLLPMADAVHHHRPVSIRYTAGDGRRSERTLHPYGVVAHAGRWYVTARDPSVGEDRTFRLDRVTDVRVLPGSFEPPAGVDPAQRVLTGLATAPHRHEVVLRIEGPVEAVRAGLPAGIAIVTALPAAPATPTPSESRDAEPRCRVELRVERLEWLPAVLASLDRPFVIERPDELRGLVEAFAERLAHSARRHPAVSADARPGGTGAPTFG